MVGLVFCVFGGVMLYLMVHINNLAVVWAARPVVKGKVVSTGIYTTSSKHGTYYHQSIDYAYVVNGQSFKGNKAWYGWHAPSWSSEAAARAALPPRNGEIMVHYDPSYPANSVAHVVVESGTQYLVEAVVYCTMTAIGLGMAVSAYRNILRRRASLMMATAEPNSSAPSGI